MPALLGGIVGFVINVVILWRARLTTWRLAVDWRRSLADWSWLGARLVLAAKEFPQRRMAADVGQR